MEHENDQGLADLRDAWQRLSQQPMRPSNLFDEASQRRIANVIARQAVQTQREATR